MEKNKKKCPFCKNGLLKRSVKKIRFVYKKQAVKVEQPGEYCDSCSEGIVSGPDMKVTEKQLHDFRQEVDGYLTSTEVREIRKKLGLTQQRAAELFGGGANAFSRYERGEVRHPKALDHLLRLLDKYPQYLREIAAKKAA